METDIKIQKKIFKAYDIRGIYPSDLNSDLAYKIGCAFVKFLNCKEVVVGQDARSSSPALFNSLTKGITDQGANVIDIGICSTPLFYFNCKDAESAIMITASHNGPEYNGFKMCRNNAIPISGDTGIFDIRDLVFANKFDDLSDKPSEKGTITVENRTEEFVQHNLKFASPDLKRFKIVVDTGNGMGGLTFPKVFEKLDLEYIPLFEDIDMTFPNHEANPIKLENVKDLQEEVVKNNANLGIAIDGDGDRCMFIDEKGNYISADLITALIAQQLLKTNQGGKILYDLRSSWAVKDVIKSAGGLPIMCRVGHAFIKQQMRDENALFAGELTGHFYYKDSFYTESSIISSLLILDLMSKENKKLSELIAPLKKYFASGEINSNVENKEKKMKELEDLYSNANQISHLDGIRIECDDWWFNVRPSNTEPKLRLNIEATTEEKMKAMRDKLLKIIRS